jgi:hypothetical protein
MKFLRDHWTLIAAALLVLFYVALAGCGQPQPSQTEEEQIESEITRHMDEEAGVVCWVYSNGYQGGISCLPIGDTRLVER